MRGLPMVRAVCLAGLLGIAVLPISADAQRRDQGPIRLSPTVLGLINDPRAGVRLEAEFDGTQVYDEDAARLNASLEADIPLTWNPERNPETLSMEAGIGLLKALITPPPPDPDGSPGLGAPTRRGYFELALKAAAEAAQALEDADLSFGVEAAYEHDQDALWFLPAIEIGFGLVNCLGCDLAEEESSWSRRLDSRIRWSIPLGPLAPSLLDPLRVRPAARWFHAWGRGDAFEAIREEEGLWGSVELAYAVDGMPLLHEVHAGWRGGDLPVKVAEGGYWYFGVTVIP